MKKRSALLVAFSLVVLLMVPAAAFAVAPNSGGPLALENVPGILWGDGLDTREPDWGTGAKSTVTYVAHAFSPIDSGVTYAFAVNGGNIVVFRTNATGNPWMEAPINLPNGARVTDVEFRFCDTSTTAYFTSFFTIEPKAGSTSQPTMVSSTVAENPGCVNRTFTLSTPITIDNANNAYSLEVRLGANDSTISFSQARVYYQLQVSPAPGIATFGDVPTSHGFFRYVEALAAAGITGGCGGGNYCPDTPVTRGQMAVFLSVALGLHWPN